MDVITSGSVASIERSLLSAHPGTRVHFHGAIEATVEVHNYGFEMSDPGRGRSEWLFSDSTARPRAAHRAAEHLVATDGTPGPGLFHAARV